MGHTELTTLGHNDWACRHTPRRFGGQPPDPRRLGFLPLAPEMAGQTTVAHGGYHL
jgi:hypothetical protein